MEAQRHSREPEVVAFHRFLLFLLNASRPLPVCFPFAFQVRSAPGCYSNCIWKRVPLNVLAPPPSEMLLQTSGTAMQKQRGVGETAPPEISKQSFLYATERNSMKCISWPGDPCPWQKGRWLLISLAGMLIFWMIATAGTSSIPVLQTPGTPRLAPASLAFGSGTLNASHQASLDPTHLSGQPGLYDARLCVSQPEDVTCDGIYLAYPPHISIFQGASAGNREAKRFHIRTR